MFENILWGDLHNHCGISYGFGSLDNALAAARQQLDFCAVTGHAMWPDMPPHTAETEYLVDFHNKGFAKLQAGWQQTVDTIKAHNTPGEFSTFYSYEMHGSQLGDYHLVSPDDNIPLVYAVTPAELLEKLAGYRGIMIPHHIGYAPGYRGISWADFDESISPVVEVCSKHGCAMHERAAYPYYHNMGARDARNTVWEGLRRGHRFGFVGSTDHHAGYPGSYGDGKLAVLAAENTREAIFAALQGRHTYAVTGDKILCDFTVNGAPMGSILPGSKKRTLRLAVRAGSAIDKIVVYKNLRPIHIVNGETLAATPGRFYKLRAEMGWGNTVGLYNWQGELRLENGRFAGVETCFRGRSILSPSKDIEADDGVNALQNRVLAQTDSTVAWECQTGKNVSTLHPATNALIFEIEGGPDTKITGHINAFRVDTTLARLLEYGCTTPEGKTNSQTAKLHTALPESAYACTVELEDAPETTHDFYHAEITAVGGNCAYITPVYFSA